MKEQALTEAYRMMHGRGVTTQSIAEAICTSRAYVSRVLTGHERRGATWRRVRALLTPPEIALLEAVPEREPQATEIRSQRSEIRSQKSPPEVRTPDVLTDSVQTTARPTVRAFNDWKQRVS